MHSTQQTPSLRTSQTIALSLMGGLLIAVVAFAFVRHSGSALATPPAPAPGGGGLGSDNILLLALGGMALMTVPMLMAVGSAMMKQAIPRYQAAPTGDEKQNVALGVLGTLTILRCAMVEGIGLFGAVIYLLNGMWPVLIAPGLALLAMAAFFPTRAKLEAMHEKLARGEGGGSGSGYRGSGIG